MLNGQSLGPSVRALVGRGRRRVYLAGGAPPKVTARSTRSIFPAAHKVWATQGKLRVENLQWLPSDLIEGEPLPAFS